MLVRGDCPLNMEVDMKQLSIMIKPASSLCNMRCKYCFYADVSSLRSVDSFGIMAQDTTDRVLGHIFSDLAPGDRLILAFQGGEPTLAGLDYFRHVSEVAAPPPGAGGPGSVCHTDQWSAAGQGVVSVSP